MPELPCTRAHLARGLGENLWTGFSVAVRGKHGQVDFAGGDVPGTSAAVPWFSAGKPVVAVAVLRILEKHPFLENQPMGALLPELAGSYVGGLTLRSILSHQTGLRILETDLGGTDQENLDFFRRITPADFRLSPGQASYDPAGGWWLLGWWITSQTRIPWKDFLEKDLLHPAGLARLRFEAPDVPIRERRAGKWIEAEPGAGPGGGLTGPAGELALFYEKVWRGELLQSSSLQKMLAPVRTNQFDPTFAHVIDFGLGVMLNRRHHGAAPAPYGFGPRAGVHAFGHGGARSSIAFADPDSGFTAAVFLNGRVPETEHQPRMHTLLTLLHSEISVKQGRSDGIRRLKGGDAHLPSTNV